MVVPLVRERLRFCPAQENTCWRTVLMGSLLKLSKEDDKSGMHLLGPFFFCTFPFLHTWFTFMINYNDYIKICNCYHKLTFDGFQTSLFFGFSITFFFFSTIHNLWYFFFFYGDVNIIRDILIWFSCRLAERVFLSSFLCLYLYCKMC